jgi:hypothetical protein
MIENWRAVVGYEGHYEVSDQGRVRSLDRLVEFKDGRSRLFRGLPQKEIAGFFDIDPSRVSDIKNGHRWGHL